MHKLSYKSLFIILFFLLIGVIVLWKFFLSDNKVSAAWWDDGWHYRQAINVDNSSGSDLTNFQVSISLDTNTLITNNKMQSDCDDIRVTDQNGNILPHFLDTTPGCNNSATQIWIKIPSIPTNKLTVFVYYGNNSTTNTSNGNQVLDNGGLWLTQWYDGHSTSPATETNMNDLFSAVNYSSRDGWGSRPQIDCTSGSCNIYGTDSNYITQLEGWIYAPEDGTYGFAVDGDDAEDLHINVTNWKGNVGGTNIATFYYGHAVSNTWNHSGNTTLTNGFYRYVFRHEEVGGSDSWRGGWKKPSDSSYDYIPATYFYYVKHTDNPPTITIPSSEEAGGGPIAYWKFDEGVGTTAFDSSSNKNNGFVSNATWQNEDQCISGKCLLFNGSTSYVNTNFGLGRDISTDPLTISMWVKPTTPTGNYMFLSPNQGTDQRFYFSTYSGKWDFGVQNSGWGSGSVNVDVNKWNHIEIVANGSTVYMYVNNKIVKQSNYTSFTLPDNIAIGSHGPNGSYKFVGLIDDVKIYSYARTAAQIKLDYNSRGSSKGSSVNLSSNKNNNFLSNGLVGYWKMEENTGTITVDSSGNNNTGTFGTGDSAPTWSSGKYSVGLSFNGTSSYISCGTGPSLNITDNITLSAWINVGGTQPNYSRIVAKNWFYDLRVTNTNKITLSFQDGSPSIGDITSNSTISNNTWYHVVGTYDGNYLYIYINGVLDKKSAATGVIPNNSTTPLRIGELSNGYGHLNGLLDEVRIYNRALSPAEVTQLYEYAPGPVGYWDFNDATGNAVQDKSGLGNTGVWSGTGSHWAQGKFGTAGNFISSNSNYVNCGSSSSILSPTYAITLSAWIKYEATSGDYYGILQKDGYANYFSVRAGDGFTVWYSNVKNWVVGNFSGILIDQKWHYVTATYDSTTSGNNMKFYVDGILRAETSASGTFVNNSNPFKIGSTPGLYFQGKIDEVRVYNYARTQKQILEDMNGSRSGLSTPFIYYKFDEGVGTTAYNSGIGGTSLNGNLGSGTSAPSWTNNGKTNKALSFNGAGTYVRIPAVSSITQTTWTAWVKPNNTNTMFVLRSAAADYLNINVYGYSFRMRTFSGSGDIFSSLGLLPTDKWSHLAMVYSYPGIKLYLNGNLTNQNVGYSLANLNNYYYIGSYLNGAEDFNGLIDEVKIFNTALSAEEIKQDYNQSSVITFGSTTQTIGATTTSLEYCIPGDTSYCTSPVAEWKMDEKAGTVVKDTGGTSNNGTFGAGNSAPTWIQGKIGSALSFDGVNDFFTTSQPNITTSPNSWTFTGFIYPENQTGYIITPGSNGIDQYLTYDGGGTQRINVHIAESSDTNERSRYSTTNSVPLNTWTHIAVSINDKNIKIYINGKLDSEYTETINIAGWTSTWNFGQRSNNTNWFKGKMDNFKVYNYIRTPAQIAYDYNKGGPIGWWKLDECQGNIAYDWSGIGNTGSINIGPSGSQTSLGTCQIGTSAAWTNGATGKINSSLNFDGVDDYIWLGSNSTLSPNNISVSSWFKINSNISGMIIRNRTYGYRLTISSGAVSTSVYESSGSQLSTSSTLSYGDNIWHNAIMTYNGTLLKLYIDGNLINTETGVGTGVIYYSGNAVGIGRDADSSGSYFTGQIDDVRIYNYALTSEQIKTLYNGGAVSFN